MPIVDREATLGREVMEYLGQFNQLARNLSRRYNTPHSMRTDDDQLYDWKAKDSPADRPAAPKFCVTEEPPLRVSNLISKQAAEGEGEGYDYVTGPDGVRYAPPRTAAQDVTKWNETFKSPIVFSLVFGALPAAIYFGVSKFVDPDEEGTKGQTVEREAGDLIDEDRKAGVQLRDREYYIQKAIKNRQARRWRNAAGIGLGAAALLHLQHINPNSWADLYRYPKTVLQKKSSMLGAPGMDFNTLQQSVMLNPILPPSIKDSALNALNYNPAPVMTSTNIINNAIYSGESAKTGLPIGRIITASAANAAVGYGVGKLLGVGEPGRMALLGGLGGGLLAALTSQVDN